MVLGDWRPPGKRSNSEASVFMHELGHNLGLHHGGDEDTNRKPNYLSIMNYSFETIGTLRSNGRQRSIDYSRHELDPLNEMDLDESVGINDPAGHLTTWNRYTRTDSPAGFNKCITNENAYYRLFYPSKALDWNCDGIRNLTRIVPDPVRGGTDINGDGKCVSPGKDDILTSIPLGDDVLTSVFITSGP